MINNICIRCKQEKPIEQFGKRSSRPGGIRHECKACQAIERRDYYERNKDKELKRSIQYAKDNPDIIAAIGKRNRPKYKELRSTLEHKRRAIKKGNGGSHTVAQWKAILVASNYTCKHCGRTDVKLTKDHIIPLTKGGTDNADNLQPLCSSCNSRKGNRHNS